MTAPTTCTCGTVHIGPCKGALSICISPGYIFDGVIQLTNRLNGQPMDWPDGTTTRMRISWGTGAELIIDGVVDGSYLRFEMTGEETEQVPRNPQVTIDLNYDAGDPLRWRPWREGRASECH